jgi:sodium transport system permease protein
MRTSRIGIIFRKELLDTLRDRKTLIFMIALPVLLVPGLAAIMARVARHEAHKTRVRRLVVEVEPEERERFTEFLRSRLRAHRAETELALGLYGPSVAEPVRRIAGELGIEPLEVLLGLSSDPKVANHPGAAGLRAALAQMQQQALERLREARRGGGADEDGSRGGTRPGAGGPLPALDEEETRAARRFLDLMSPLVTFDFVSAAEARERPAERPGTPESELPPALRARPERAAAAIAISERRIHARIGVPRGLDRDVDARFDTVTIEAVYDSTVDLSAEANRRIEASIAAAREMVVSARLAREDLPASFVAPLRLEAVNAAPPSKEVLRVVASFLPYILILMCFVGGLYPATDLGAGEKERLTLETLLVAPASRFEIAAGKFGVVFLTALVAGVLATASMAYTFTSGLALEELSAALEIKLDAGAAALSLALIAPLAAVFASAMLALSIYARSQKEAQSLMMPLQFLIIVPAMLSMIPTIELDTGFAWVPVMNVALGLRTILTASGAPMPWLEFGIILVSTSLFALLALAWCARRFRDERVIFRS